MSELSIQGTRKSSQLSRSSSKKKTSQRLSSLASNNDVGYYLSDIASSLEALETMKTDSALRDKFYMKSFQLRNLFRSLDVLHVNTVAVSKVKEAFAKELNIRRPDELAALDRVLAKADTDGTKMVRYDAFTNALRDMASDAQPSDPALESQRFHSSGITRGMHRVLNRDEDVGLINRRPANELGVARTNPPYNMLGDSERIAAMHSAVLVAREEQQKKVLEEHDANHDGRLTHREFRAAIRQLEPQVSVFHEGDLIRQLDVERTGTIVVDDFLRRFGFTFLQPASLRGSLGAGNILAWNGEVSPGDLVATSHVVKRAGRKTFNVSSSKSLSGSRPSGFS